MIGLIKKDLYMVKGNLKTLGIIFGVFLLMALNGNDNFAFVPAFMSVMIMMSTFSYDEYNKSDAYIQTFPNGKKNVVLAKYFSSILVTLLAILLTFVLIVIVRLIKNNVLLKDTFESVLGCGVGILLLQAIMYPFIFQFGIEKGRIGIFVAIFALTTVVGILSQYHIAIPNALVVLLERYGMFLIPILTLLILYSSYQISKKIYFKKEF